MTTRIRWQAANMHLQRQAWNILTKEIGSGSLRGVTICEDCKEASDRIQGHHEDYAKPRDIIWLCLSCHQRRHGAKRARAEQAGSQHIRITQILSLEEEKAAMEVAA